MIFKIRYPIFILVILLTCWISWSSYRFFFDSSDPIIQIDGLENEHAYARDIPCTITSTKSGDLSIWLDEQPLIAHFRVSRNRCHSFAIPTATISYGKHTIKFSFIDSTYHKRALVDERTFYVDNLPLKAAFMQPDGDYKVLQGRTLHIQFQTNKPIKKAEISALSQTFSCCPESKNSLVYETFIPIACEENPNEYLFTLNLTDQVGNSLSVDNKFQVIPYPFKKTNLVISPEKIKQEEELGEEAKKLEEILVDLAKKSPQEKLWRGSFCTPIDIAKITCDYGTIRTTQHKGRYAHKALDLLNQPRSVVWSTQDGKVVLKQRFEHSGNTVIVDHGLGILSLFFHLDSFAKINEGDFIAKGNPVGTIGKTGYATGYHLHWEMRINNMPVDPMQWTSSTF